VAVDTANNAYIVGTTVSSDFPTTSNAFQKNAPLAITNAKNSTAFRLPNRHDIGREPPIGLLELFRRRSFRFGLAVALGPNKVAYATGATTRSRFPHSLRSISNDGTKLLAARSSA